MASKPELHIDVDAAGRDEHDMEIEDDDMYSDESSVSPRATRCELAASSGQPELLVADHEDSLQAEGEIDPDIDFSVMYAL